MQLELETLAQMVNNEEEIDNILVEIWLGQVHVKDKVHNIEWRGHYYTWLSAVFDARQRKIKFNRTMGFN